MNTRTSDPPLLQSTNTSATVSKRSAERAGYYDEEQWLRPFVGGGVKRRSPQINLGYYIRSRCIQDVLQTCISTSQSSTIVINLGAGYDATFFRLASHSPKDYQNAKVSVLDIDYPELIDNKVRIINEDFKLKGFFEQNVASGAWNESQNGMRYGLLGVDLSDLNSFKDGVQRFIRHHHHISGSTDIQEQQQLRLIFMAEVSIIYLPPERVSVVLDFASSLPNSTLIVLEQFIPSSSEQNSSYVQTMLSHFKSHQTPLLSLSRWRTLQDVRRRLEERWATVCVKTLKEWWDKNGQIEKWTKEEFDEWEEMLLFLSHYYIGIGSNDVQLSNLSEKNLPFSSHQSDNHLSRTTFYCSELSPRLRLRGHTVTCIRPNEYLVFGGYGSASGGKSIGRSNSTFLLDTNSNRISLFSTSTSSRPVPTPRVHHIAFKLGHKYFIHGGRTTPSSPLNDFWEMDLTEKDKTWKESIYNDGPSCRSRHACVVLKLDKDEIGVLMGGGIGANSEVKNDWWIWTFKHSWRRINLVADGQIGVFGHDLTLLPHLCSSTQFSILLTGGLNSKYKNVGPLILQINSSMDTDGASWTLIKHTVQFTNQQYGPLLSRFGARSAYISSLHKIYLAGGVCMVNSQPEEQVAVLLDVLNVSWEPVVIEGAKERTGVDHTICVGENDNILVVGGACNAFSFGTKWDDGILLLSLTAPTRQPIESSTETTQELPAKKECAIVNGTHAKHLQEPIPLQRIKVKSREDFYEVMKRDKPVVLEGLTLGVASDKWTPEYLIDKVGSKRVSVHVSSTSDLSWHNKNFRYQTMTFSELIRRVFSSNSDEGSINSQPTKTNECNETLYLRSLSHSAKKAAILDNDFPELEGDFVIPEELDVVKDGLFSSPLRVSGNDMGLWPHYDVYDNILTQVRGRKKVRLWTPEDIDKLYISGSSSMITSPFSPSPAQLSQFPLFPSAQAYETVLEPNDIIYIPSLWIHAIQTLSPSIGVNVFFKSPLRKDGLYEKKDVWGNVDLVPFKEAKEAALNKIGKLEGNQKTFYLKKLAMELTELANSEERSS